MSQRCPLGERKANDNTAAMKSSFFVTSFTLFGQTVSTQPRRFTLLSSALSFCMAMLPSLAVGQTVSIWAGGGTENWLDGAAWSPNGVPSGASADVVIDGPVGAPASVLYGRNDNVGTNITIGRLTLGAGDGVSFGSATTKLTLGDNAAFSGAGSLVIDGTLSLPFSSNGLSGVKSLTGTGMLLLGSTGQRPEITDQTTNAMTIKGSALFGRANASNPRTINSGLIEANLSGQDIDFHGQGGANRSVNTGILKATGGAVMSFGQGEWLNTGGTINADGAGARAAFYRGGLIEGGTISATNGGMLQVGGSFTGGNGGATFKNVTLTGPTNLVQELLVNETLTNNGVISIPDGGRLGNASNSVTIAGTGQIVLDAAEDNSPELINQGNSSLPSIPWLFSGVKVRGRGNVGYRQSLGTIDNVAITNQGTFEADVDGQTLLIDVANLDNRSGGLLRATGSGNNALGGVLRLTINGPLKNTGGTIEAVNTGRVEAGRVRVEGGLVRNVGGFIDLNGWTLVNPGTGMRLEGEHTMGHATAYQEARLVGEIENTGVVRIVNGTQAARLWLTENANPSVTLTGGGEIVLGDAATPGRPGELWEGYDGAFGTRTVSNVNHTIRGYGRIGNTQYDTWMALQNSHLVEADVSGQTLSIGLLSATNAGGTFRAKLGGRLDLYARGGFNNTGGVIEANSGGSVTFAGGTQVTHGVMRNNGGSFNLSNATLINGGSGFTLQGTFVVDASKTVGLVGDITNEGTIHLRPTGSTRSTIGIGRTGTLSNSISGGGELVLGDATLPGANDPRLSVANGAPNNMSFTLNDQTLRGFGVVGFDQYDSREMLLTNNGSIRADVSGKTLTFVPNTLTNSPGKVIRATGGGEAYFNPVSLTNTGAALRAEDASKLRFDGNMVLIGGTVETQPGGTMEFIRQFTAQGGVIFSNAGTALFGTGNGNVTFEGLANGGSSFINAGTMRKTGTGEYILRTALNSTGAINVESGVMRNFGGGTSASGSFATSAGANLTFQGSPSYTFSGINHFTGEGMPAITDTTTLLADASTELRANHFRFYNATLSGPGLLSHSGQLHFYPATSNTISGARVRTLSGATAAVEVFYYAPLNLTNAAIWENAGAIVFKNEGWRPVIVGTPDTLIVNQSGGVIRNDDSESGTLDIPTQNNGTVVATKGLLVFAKPTSWTSGAASISTGAEIRISSTTLTANGLANTSAGAGWMQVNGSGSLALPAGSRLTANRIGFWDTSSISGPGELWVQFAADWNLPSNVTQVVNGTQVNLLLGSSNQFIGTNRTLRLQNQALMRNAGTMTFRAATQLKLESNSVYENAGTTEFNPSGTGNLAYVGSDDGTGLFRTLEDSITRFVPNSAFRMSFGVPVEFAGQVYANAGYQVTFAQGGLLKSTAKLWPNHPSSSITFAGAAALRVQGRNNEFSGTGIVRFSNTRISFEDPSTDPADDPLIAAGATVAFVDATNTVEGNGLLSGTQFTFAGASTTINQTTLRNSEGWNSNWIASGGTLTLQNGARFLNQGIFTVSTRIGAWTGTLGTLFHNQSTGRFVHDTSNATVIDVPFQNDGILEVRAGTLNFSSSYTGTGGVAASNGAKLTMPLSSTALGLLPSSIQTIGAGSEITANLPNGDKLIALEASGGRLVAAGGGNLVAAGGGNILSHNGGVLVAAGGMNLVAAGGGNITVAGANSRIEGSGSLVAAGGGNILSHNGGVLVAAGGLNADGGAITADAGRIETPGNLVAAGGGNVLSHNGGVLVAAGGLNADGGTITADAGRIETTGNLVAAGGGNILSHNGGVLVAAGGLNGNGSGIISATGAGSLIQANNLVAAGGMNLVAAGGGNIVAAGGLNGSGGGALQARMASFGEAPSSGPGTITVDTGSRLAGDGTFEGQGEVMNGSSVNPGFEALGGSNQVGAMQWNGSLEIAAGASLNLQLGGTTAGTQHDSLNVSQAFIMNGTLVVTFVNGFGASINSTHTFDVAVAAGGITSSLAGTRIPVASAYGTFLVTLVNGGTTLRLSDYQLAAPTFSHWATIHGLSGPDADLLADPFQTGTSNLLKYALGLSPQSSGSPIISGTWQDLSGQQFLTLSYTRPQAGAAPSDIVYEPQRSTTLAAGDWQSGPAYLLQVGSPTPGPGDLETITVRSVQPISPTTPLEFLRLRVEQIPPTP